MGGYVATAAGAGAPTRLTINPSTCWSAAAAAASSNTDEIIIVLQSRKSLNAESYSNWRKLGRICETRFCRFVRTAADTNG